MAHINLNKKSFFNNLDIIAHLTSSKDKIAVVLKDNAYGHGSTLIAQMCREYGIKKAVVRNQQEALEVKEFFDYILVLADIPDVAIKNAVYTVNALDQIDNFPVGASVEIKVDSKMHRNGVSFDALEAAFKKCIARGLHVKGIFTHHRGADELSGEWFMQEQAFGAIKKRALELASKFGIEKLNIHSQNSAALFRAGSCMHDMVRVGIAAYGCLSKDETLFQGSGVQDLQPVLSLYASKIATRLLKKGERLGYGGVYEAEKDMVVSTYDVGYADGLLREASNNYATPTGERILGRISMDNISIDSDKKNLCIFNDANQYATSCGTISYEILVGMNHTIKRSIV